ncbi:hypothetical protein P9597_10675 [Aneurinibacillus migulanus]|uniref:5' nucleotidase, NT5C type n=1 Tax=Aneurinibacillus migulanus TaxID=47500 RepID=UPI002E200169|nr:hypothetical protein [Aneurinibacillus migulanus]
MKNQIILVDVDNTISQTNRKLRELIPNFTTERYPFPFPPLFFEESPIFDEVEPVEGAKEKLKEWCIEGHWIYYVTARESSSFRRTVKWLKRHGFPSSPVICCKDKQTIARIIGATIAIDDAPHEIEQLKDVVSRIFVPAHDYNQRYENRFFNWEELAI